MARACRPRVRDGYEMCLRGVCIGIEAIAQQRPSGLCSHYREADFVKMYPSLLKTLLYGSLTHCPSRISETTKGNLRLHTVGRRSILVQAWRR